MKNHHTHACNDNNKTSKQFVELALNWPERWNGNAPRDHGWQSTRHIAAHALFSSSTYIFVVKMCVRFKCYLCMHISCMNSFGSAGWDSFTSRLTSCPVLLCVVNVLFMTRKADVSYTLFSCINHGFNVVTIWASIRCCFRRLTDAGFLFYF